MSKDVVDYFIDRVANTLSEKFDIPIPKSVVVKRKLKASHSPVAPVEVTDPTNNIILLLKRLPRGLYKVSSSDFEYLLQHPYMWDQLYRSSGYYDPSIKLYQGTPDWMYDKDIQSVLQVGENYFCFKEGRSPLLSEDLWQHVEYEVIEEPIDGDNYKIMVLENTLDFLKTLEGQLIMEELYQGNFDLACKDYLKHSYLYYIKDQPEVSDSYYDYLCRYLYTNYSFLPEQYKVLIGEDNLRAGTGFTIKEEDYPTWVKGN